jgi:hypothetical protein
MALYEITANYLLLIKCSTQTFAKLLCRELLYNWLEINDLHDVIFHTHE